MSHSIGWLVARCRYFREQTPPWTPPCGSVSHSRPAFIIRVLFVSPCTKKKAVRFEECVRASTKSYDIFTTEKKKSAILNGREWMKKCSFVPSISETHAPTFIFFCLAKNEAQTSMHGYTLSRRAEQTEIAD